MNTAIFSRAVLQQWTSNIAQKKCIESDLQAGHSARSSKCTHKIYCEFLFRKQTHGSIVLSRKAFRVQPLYNLERVYAV